MISLLYTNAYTKWANEIIKIIADSIKNINININTINNCRYF